MSQYKYRLAKVTLSTFLLGLSLLTSTSVLADTIDATNIEQPSRAPFKLAEGGTQAKTLPAGDQDAWWKHAVIYEIYPRSFKDSDDSGTGDLKGIIEKLDYLADLGIDAIWLTPCYPSPQVDFGYDISDYCDIDPQYGTLSDFDKLVEEGKKRGIRIIMDLVLNHTSDKHKWFIESSSSKDNRKRDWFIWKDPNRYGDAPNNWISLFGGSAWTEDPSTKQYYYHFFYKEQPDLNWRNPDVKNAMFDVARFWLKRGTAGFRLDAVNTLYEDPQLTDNPIEPGVNAYGDPNTESKYNYLLLSDIHKSLKELRRVINEFKDKPVLIGETTAEKLDHLVSMYGENDDEIQLPMNFRFAYINELSAEKFRNSINEIESHEKAGWPVWVLSNHDAIRHYDRYGKGKNKDQIAKLMATLLLTLRGTPIMYYGEELGMTNREPRSKKEVKDPIGIVGWPEQKGRDGERTPMQWTPGKNAGFTGAKPWLPVASNFKTHNVQSEKEDPSSILNTYKRLLELRRSNVALKEGKYISIGANNKDVLSYIRKAKTATVLVALNMSSETRTLGLTKEDAGRENINLDSSARLIFSTIESNLEGPEKFASVGELPLAPYEAVILELP